MTNSPPRRYRFAMLLLAAAPVASCMTSVAQPPPEAPVARMVNDSALQWGACPPIFAKGCEIAVLHGDPSRPNADIFLRVPGGYKLPAHSHTSVERMILVTGQLRVQYRGFPAATLSEGQYAFGPAGLPHEGACLSSGPCTLFIAFEGPVDAHASDETR